VTTQTQLNKRYFYIACYKIARPNGRIYKSPVSIAGETDLGRGEIFVTLPFLFPNRSWSLGIGVDNDGTDTRERILAFGTYNTRTTYGDANKMVNIK